MALCLLLETEKLARKPKGEGIGGMGEARVFPAGLRAVRRADVSRISLFPSVLRSLRGSLHNYLPFQLSADFRCASDIIPVVVFFKREFGRAGTASEAP